MLHPKPCLLSTILKIIVPALVLLFIVSCKTSDSKYLLPTITKKYPKNTPFVYKTNVKLTGDLSKTDKANLLSRLQVQLEDSVNPKASQKLLWQVIKRPPVFDTMYVNRSITFMRYMLHSSGYFHDSVTYDTILRKDNDEYKTILNFNVKPGPVTIVDSIWYNIEEPELQRLADSTQADSLKKQRKDSITLGVSQPFQKLADSSVHESYLRKGMTFSSDTIGMELDRLVELYRNNGFLKFTRNELIGVWDTLDAELLQPMTNPLEQIQLMNEIARRRQHPTSTLEIGLRPGHDPGKLVKYYVGKTYIFPDYGPDTTNYKIFVLDSNYTIKYHENIFKPRIFPQNIYFARGQAYSQSRYISTVNRFNTLIAWRLVNIEQKPREGTDTVDFSIKLSPARKYLFTANLESSRNDNAFTEGNLLGVGVNVGLQNRNFLRSASQTNTNMRYGTELDIRKDKKLLHSRQASLGYNIFIPWGIPKFRFFPERLKEKFRGNTKTIVGFNVANTQLIDYYNLTTFNASWGYEWQYKNKLFALKFPNVEYSLLKSRPKLDDIFLQHPGLKNVFNDGLIISGIGSFTINGGTKKIINTFKSNGEISGLPTLIHSPFIQKNLYRFIKIDGEFKRLMKIGTSDFVARLFVGVGIPVSIKNGTETRSQYLPFFKAYGAGGPNSMRGWGLRRLGPGSSSLYYDSIPDRFGDIQFETNVEYRFHAFDMFGFKINSALFTDIGNVWFSKKNPDFPGGEIGSMKKFFKDLAVDVGTGLRVDLGFFLIRLDYAFKVVNPSPEPTNAQAQFKWFYGWNFNTFLKGTIQFGVTYPF
jgi:outer membrane protein insertion porin family